MNATHASSAHTADRTNTLVVLATPLCLVTASAECLRSLLEQRPRTRLLALATERGHVAKIDALAAAGFAIEAVLAPGLDPPTIAIRSITLPTVVEAERFCLALSDVLVTLPDESGSSLMNGAHVLGKHITRLDETLPSLPPPRDVTGGLDPDALGWHTWGRRLFGRGEQIVLELLAFNWRGWRAGGIMRSLRRIGACCGHRWRPRVYHGPDDWPKVAPDLAARDLSSPLVARFEALDRSALYGSYVHRDQIWFTHIMAAFAVVFAVGGVALHDGATPAHGWAIAELITLAAIAAVIGCVRRTDLHERWTACRMGAEQLRIARMCLPVLALPDILCVGDDPPKGGRTRTTDYTSLVAAQVKRAVRDHGLPLLDPAASPRDAVRWVRLVVADQATYHLDNHRRLELLEQRLNVIKTAIFGLAIAAVVAELLAPDHVLLFFTAAGPAFAAALHGAETRLGIVHRAALSRDAHVSLHHVERDLAHVMAAGLLPDDIATHVRGLALRAATDMGNENTSWHSLVRRQRDDVPT